MNAGAPRKGPVLGQDPDGVDGTALRAASLLRRQTVGLGVRSALLFALLAEHLARYYDQGQWFKHSQAVALASDWLRRGDIALPPREVQAIAHLSDALAREIAGTLSRQAGLYTAHELMESLDPNHQSDVATALMDECRQRVLALDQADASEATIDSPSR